MATALLTAALTWWNHSNASAQNSTTRDFSTHFADVVFTAGVDRIIKWDKPVMVRMAGIVTDPRRAYVRAHLRQLAEFTNHDFSLFADQGRQKRKPNALIILTEDVNKAATTRYRVFMQALSVPGNDIDATVREQSDRECYLRVGGQNYRISAILLFINLKLDEMSFRRCILSTFTSSVGIWGKISDGTIASVFHKDRASEEITRFDRSVLAALYDVAITPGATRAQVQKIVREMNR